MKSAIHPQYYMDAKVTCACGAVHNIPGTIKDIKVEICSNCHPFYTGNEKLIDTAGRVDKFKKRMALKTDAKPAKKKTAEKSEK